MSLEETLDILQSQCDILYGQYGATDNIIQLQVAINRLRHEHNIPDEADMTVSNPGFVQ